MGALWWALAASIWGGMYVVSKIVLIVMPALTLVWLWYVVALGCLGGIGLATRQSWRIQWRHVPRVVATGLIGFGLSIWAQFRGTQLNTAQMGSIVTAATAAFMVIFGHATFGEPITWCRGMSVGLATIGVLMVVGVGGFSSGHLGGALSC